MDKYKEIQKIYKKNTGQTAAPCWIAHVLSDYGFTKRMAPNRINPNVRKKPCPVSKRQSVKIAIREFGLI